MSDIRVRRLLNKLGAPETEPFVEMTWAKERVGRMPGIVDRAAKKGDQKSSVGRLLSNAAPKSVGVGSCAGEVCRSSVPVGPGLVLSLLLRSHHWRAAPLADLPSSAHCRAT